MNGAFIITAFVIFAVLITAMITRLLSFIENFAKETRYICYKKDYAESYEEYRKWRGELRCHYLMLIPFVTERNVMRLYNRIFHKSDN